MAKFGKKNKVSLNPLDANICLLGLPKIGKTTIMKEVAEKNNVVCLELGKEMANRYNTMSDEDVKKNHMVYDIVKDQLKILESEHNNSNVKQQKDDTTHLTETGANFVADVICDLLRSSNSKLKDYLKD